MPAPSSKKKTKKTAFVPRGLFSAIAGVAVIPLCACGGDIAPSNPIYASVGALAFDSGQGNRDAGPDAPEFTVGVAAFDATFDVATRAFDAGEDVGIIGTVAACCFDATFDVATSAFDAGPDVGFIVATNGFDASTDAAADAPTDAPTDA
jgi:hypothetical protein